MPRKYMGSFVTEMAAARAYDQEAWDARHDFTRLNFPEEYQRASGIEVKVASRVLPPAGN
jgi:hypothetical protein